IQKDARLKEVATFINYDGYYGNLLEFQNVNETSTSLLWGYNKTLPIAKVVNAAENQIFYNSFEDLSSGYVTEAKTGVKARSGTYSVPLPAAGGTYRLTYWKKTGTGSWQFIEDTMSANKTIGGSGIVIDEVRVCP